jgi:PPOX class probable F420-dependent enzyme
MDGLTPDLVALVRDARVARLATVDEVSRPHVVPVCFVYRDGVAYVALDAKPKRVPVTQLRRVRNLLANPDVQLLVDHYEEDWSSLVYVQLRGLAGLLGPGGEHAEALALLRAKYKQYQAMALDDTPIIRIEVRQAVGWTAQGATLAHERREDR